MASDVSPFLMKISTLSIRGIKAESSEVEQEVKKTPARKTKEQKAIIFLETGIFFIG